MHPTPRRARILLLFGSTIVSLVVADLFFRWLGPGRYSAPSLTDATGHQVTLYQIIEALRAEPPRPNTGPRGPGPAEGRGAPFTITYDRPRWDYFDASGSVVFDFNTLGFRDREFRVTKQPDEYRILAIGDSFTFGLGVRLRDSWPQQLERRLAAGRSTPVEVINAGFAGRTASPTGYLPWVETDGTALQPDMVILGFCLNDMHPNIPMLGYPIVHPRPLFFGLSSILNFIQREVAQQNARTQPFDATEILATRGDAYWKECQSAVRRMHELLTGGGSRFLVVIQPMITRLGDDYPYVGLHRMVRDFCAAAGIECLDLLPRFRGRDAADLQIHPTDQHPNHVGHRIIADGIFDYLRRR